MNRNFEWSRKAGTHAFSFGSVFSGVETPYSLELLIQLGSLVTFCYLMLHIYGLLKDVNGLMERYNIATSTGDFSDFNEEDRQQLIDEITNISQTW